MKVLLLLFLLSPSFLFGQDVNLIADKNPFLAHSLIDHLDASRIGFGRKYVNNEKTLFEAQVVPYIVSPNINLLPLFPTTLVISPAINLRMLNSRSNPVRTPSYKPSLRMYWYSNRIQRGCYECFHGDNPESCISGPADVLKSAFLSLQLEHHSNGQSGDLLNPDNSINFIDGNFSANKIEPSIHFLTSLYSQTRIYAQWFPDINREIDLEDHYGFIRAGAEIVWAGDKGNSYLRAKAEVILDEYTNIDGSKRDAIDRWTFNVRYEHDLFGWTDLGLFTELHFGPDYYNLRFSRNLRAVQFGFFARLYRVSSKLSDLKI